MQRDVSANTALCHRLARLKVQTGQLRQEGDFIVQLVKSLFTVPADGVCLQRILKEF